MILGIKFKVNESLYSRDPQDTELGKKILKNSIILIDDLGFEQFNFKKLAHEIGSTEKSIYRYFPNKHFLLLFLTSWYWEWVHYLISTNIKYVDDANKRLNIAIHCIVRATSENSMNEYINEHLLHRVVIKEGAKSYHTALVDEENKGGFFQSYTQVVNAVSDLILAINPGFKYATSMASNLFEMANNQVYFAEHLPRLTSLCQKGGACEEELINMLEHFTERMLKA